MIHSIKIWNEPNNLNHWDFRLDPGWETFAALVRETSATVRGTGAEVPLVMGGLCPVDPDFLRRMRRLGALDAVDAVAMHAFPFDWNLWPVEELPERAAALREEFGKPVWITELGASSFASETAAAWGLRRIREVLTDEKAYWYTLIDLHPQVPATSQLGPGEGSSYFRHFHFGLLHADGTPKKAVDDFDPTLGVCQWFQFEDERTLETAVRWLEKLEVRSVRTGLSWLESRLPGADRWFDTVMAALEPFEVCATLCFTPPDLGLRPDHTSPPREVAEFARFAAEMVERYGAAHAAAGEQM